MPQSRGDRRNTRHHTPPFKWPFIWTLNQECETMVLEIGAVVAPGAAEGLAGRTTFCVGMVPSPDLVKPPQVCTSANTHTR